MSNLSEINWHRDSTTIGRSRAFSGQWEIIVYDDGFWSVCLALEEKAHGSEATADAAKTRALSVYRSLSK